MNLKLVSSFAIGAFLTSWYVDAPFSYSFGILMGALSMAIIFLPLATKMGVTSKFLDHDGWLNSNEIPTLKALFENLRNYPMLAIYFAATNKLYKYTDLNLVAISYFLFFIFGLLLILSIFQMIQLSIATVGNITINLYGGKLGIFGKFLVAFTCSIFALGMTLGLAFIVLDLIFKTQI